MAKLITCTYIKTLYNGHYKRWSRWKIQTSHFNPLVNLTQFWVIIKIKKTLKYACVLPWIFNFNSWQVSSAHSHRGRRDLKRWLVCHTQLLHLVKTRIENSTVFNKDVEERSQTGKGWSPKERKSNQLTGVILIWSTMATSGTRKPFTVRVHGSKSLEKSIASPLMRRVLLLH